MAFVTHEIAVGAGSYAPSHEYCMTRRVRMNDGRMTHVDELRACKQAKRKIGLVVEGTNRSRIGVTVREVPRAMEDGSR